MGKNVESIQIKLDKLKSYSQLLAAIEEGSVFHSLYVDFYYKKEKGADYEAESSARVRVTKTSNIQAIVQMAKDECKELMEDVLGTMRESEK